MLEERSRWPIRIVEHSEPSGTWWRASWHVEGVLEVGPSGRSPADARRLLVRGSERP